MFLEVKKLYIGNFFNINKSINTLIRKPPLKKGGFLENDKIRMYSFDKIKMYK